MATTDYFSIQMPDPEQTIGPEWAQQLNDAINQLTEVVALGAVGMEISNEFLNVTEDFDFNGFDLKEVNSVELATQVGTLASTGSIYQVSGDLYYNNNSGTPVQITSGNALSATSLGGITGMAGTPASVTFDGVDTFSFEQDVGIPASMNQGPTKIRRPVAASAGVSIEVANTIASDYTFKLPASLPGASSFLTINASGDVAFSPATAGGITDSFLATGAVTEAKIASSAVTNTKIATDAVTEPKIQAGAVTESRLASNSVSSGKIQNSAVTRVKLAAVGQQLSASCGTFSTTNVAFTNVTNLSVTVVGTGRPIFVGCQSDESGNMPYFGITPGGLTERWEARINVSGSASANIGHAWSQVSVIGLLTPFPPSSVQAVYIPAGTGTFTFQVQLRSPVGAAALAYYMKLIAYEIA